MLCYQLRQCEKIEYIVAILTGAINPQYLLQYLQSWRAILQHLLPPGSGDLAEDGLKSPHVGSKTPKIAPKWFEMGLTLLKAPVWGSFERFQAM